MTGSVWFQGGCYVLLFLTCVVVCTKVRVRKVREAVLLISSMALYLTWQPWFAAVLFTSIIVNFLIGRWLRINPHWLTLSVGVIFNLVLLSAFKYVPALTIHLLPVPLQPLAHLALPLGISFWTFQGLSYLFDLYRGEELDPSLAEFALYMVFFPVTISGPVCRLPDMLPQFRSEETTPWSDIAAGFRRIAIGFFMMQLGKLLGQGILAGDGIVSGFDHATRWTGPDVWCLGFGYGLQLFFDFAGYSHMAIGAAKALGITVPENFERPFASTNTSIFWTRWHMSLSFWIRDYVFFPLAPFRRELWWRNLALALSMVVFGLWHKATLLFLIWGSYQGALLVMHRQVQQLERRKNWEPPKIWTPLSWTATAVLVSFGWIFFRANSTTQARQMLAAIATPASYSAHHLSTSLFVLIAMLAVGYSVVLLLSDAIDRESITAKSPEPQSRSILAVVARWRWYWLPAVYGLALLFVLMITLTQQGGVGQMMYRSF
ncbi:MAG TPA: MBOAT family O-acyltransferase [Dongiaceae bacterium]|nr:MBOAT family O-acyltransferase [Dongiaceae bacterium]